MDNVQHTSYTPIPTQGFTDHETILTSEHLQTLEGGVIKNDDELEDVIRSHNAVDSTLNYYFANLAGLNFVDYGSLGGDVLYPTETETVHTQSKRSGFRFYVNGTLDADESRYYFKLSNTYEELQGTNTKYFVTPVVLTDQHVYYWMVKLISGSVTKTGSDATPFDACITINGKNSFVNTISTDGDASISYVLYRTSVYTSGLHFTIRMDAQTGVTFNNAVFECMLLDLTYYGDFNIASPETPYQSNDHNVGDYMFDAGGLRKATSNFSTGDYVYSHQTATTVTQELALKADKQEITTEATARAEADANVVNIIDNMNAGLIEYGYTNNPYTGTNAFRQGTRFTITANFSPSSAQAAYKFSNNWAYASKADQVRAFTNPIKLQDGHTYRWYQHYVSGTLTTTSDQLLPLRPEVYIPNGTGSGNVQSIGQRTMLNGTWPYNDVYTDFVYSDNLYPDGLHLCARVGRRDSDDVAVSCQFDNAMFDYYLYDITPGLPVLPTEAGTYVLKVTVSNNIPTYSWQATT